MPQRRPRRRPPLVLTLFLIFTVFTLAELWLIVQLAELTNWPFTIAVAILSGIIGSVMIKREGIAVWRQGQRDLQQGRFPARSIAEGIVILVGGAFLVTPGLITDIIGLSALIPPARRVWAKGLTRWAKRNIRVTGGGPGALFTMGGRPGGSVFEPGRETYGSRETRSEDYTQVRSQPVRRRPDDEDVVDVEFRRKE